MAHLAMSGIKKITLGLISGLILVSGVSVPAQAYPAGGVYGRDAWHGYFTDTYDTFGTVVLQPRSNLQAIPYDTSPGGTTIDTVVELIALLQGANNNTANSRDGRNDRTGSAFIVYTMLGLNGANHDRKVSDANWAELTARLDDRQAAGKILWYGNVANGVNSIYLDAKNSTDTATDDAAFHDQDKDEPGIRILNDDNTTAYDILRRCANPMGSTGVPVVTPKHFYLTPTASIAPNGVVEPGATVTVTNNVNNSGNVNSTAAPWVVSKFTLPSGSTPPVLSNDSAQTPAVYYGGAWTAIGGDPGGIFAPGNTNPGTATDATPDVAAGTLVCYALSVQNYSNDPVTTNWRHSAASCVKIGKRPKLQVLGGDLISRGTVSAGSVYKNISGTNYTFGSWVEYGIFAVGTISHVGSGSAYSGTGLANAGNCNMSTLSFANAGSSTCTVTTEIGKYAYASPIPDVAASFPVTGGTPSFGGGELANQSKTGIFKGSGAINLMGATIDKGRWLVINAPTADVTIRGNIIYYNGVMNYISDIPQVVIIARNINIEGGVTQVDAWLIASGSLNTCSDVPLGAQLSTATCNQPLVINGPVMAGQVHLRRTAGSGTGADRSGDPAEIFNLRPDAYLWASARATGTGRIQTVYTTELPPRL